MKFSGSIGFWEGDRETRPGIWTPTIVERPYVGDIYRFSHRFQSVNNHQNDDFIINNQISILADLYALQNWASIKYVVWNGSKWKVNSIDVTYPRLTLELGGLYNDENSTRSS